MKDTVSGFWTRPTIADVDQGNYEAFVERRQRRIVMPILIVATIVMVALVGLDALVVPDALALSIALRVFVVVPVAVIVLAYLSTGRRSRRAHHVVCAFVPILYGSLACFILARSQEPLAAVYASANNITIMFAVLMLGMAPLWAAGTALALIAIQSLALSYATYMNEERFLLVTAISAAVSLIALFGNWRMDVDQRRQFRVRRHDGEMLADLSARNALLERLSALDSLTGLSNRRGFEAILSSAVEDAAGSPAGSYLAIAMIDVDHFKLFNDTLGHMAGDDALREIGHAISRAVAAPNELAARYGGEEFVVIVQNANPQTLLQIGLRLRAGVERLRIPHPVSPTAPVITVSIGLAHVECARIGTFGADGLMMAADAALYRAKAKGRNTVVVRECSHANSHPRPNRPFAADSGKNAAALAGDEPADPTQREGPASHDAEPSRPRSLRV